MRAAFSSQRAQSPKLGATRCFDATGGAVWDAHRDVATTDGAIRDEVSNSWCKARHGHASAGAVWDCLSNSWCSLGQKRPPFRPKVHQELRFTSLAAPSVAGLGPKVHQESRAPVPSCTTSCKPRSQAAPSVAGSRLVRSERAVCQGGTPSRRRQNHPLDAGLYANRTNHARVGCPLEASSYTTRTRCRRHSGPHFFHLVLPAVLWERPHADTGIGKMPRGSREQNHPRERPLCESWTKVARAGRFDGCRCGNKAEAMQ